MPRNLNVAVEGCCHGELDLIYDTIRDVGSKGVKVDLLLVCGDFQCVRNAADLQSLAVPHKYRTLKNFHEYVSGKKVAPVTTIFIGGNHEASNILQSLYYGGWVAPNIYFLGYGGVLWFGGIRIAGLSGIYNGRHYRLGHYENPPYTDDALRSVYHLRETEVYRMAHINISAYPIDVFLSHDWPGGVWEFGDKARLLSRKSFLQEDMISGKLGSPPLMDILRLLRPTLWFAAHLHVKYAAIVPHSPAVATPSPALKSTSEAGTYCQPVGVSSTRFLALDKCLPGRDFLQVVSVPPQYDDGLSDHPVLSYDSEWLAVMRKTHTLLSTSRGSVSIPHTVQPVTAQEIVDAERMMKSANGGSLMIAPLPPNPHPIPNNTGILTDPQTDFFLSALGLNHIWTRPSNMPATKMHARNKGHVDDVEVEIDVEVEAFVDKQRDLDPNHLSISDDEEECETEKTHENQKETLSQSKMSLNTTSAADPNEICCDDDEDDDWTAASVSASTICSTNITLKAPTASLRAPAVVAKAAHVDVISFDDVEQIIPDAPKLFSALKLPPPKGT